MPKRSATSPGALDITSVHWLISCATASGADSVRVQQVAEQLVDALLDLQAFRNGDHDPRRQETLQLARRVQRAQVEGASVQALAERFGRGRSTIYKLLSLATSRDISARQYRP